MTVNSDSIDRSISPVNHQEDRVLYYSRIIQCLNQSGQDAATELSELLREPQIELNREEYFLQSVVYLIDILHQDEELLSSKKDYRAALISLQKVAIQRFNYKLLECISINHT